MDELSEANVLVDDVAELHRASMDKSSTGKFGLGVPSHVANIPNDNSWTETWENNVHAAYEGHLGEVVPKLLRPIKIQSRRIKPILLHGDLWIGNNAIDEATRRPVISDSSPYVSLLRFRGRGFRS